MTNWQQKAPDTIGTSWLPATIGAYLVDTATRAYAWRWEQQANIDIDTVYLPARAENILTPGGGYLFELFESGDEVVADEVTTSVYRPTADALNQGPSWQKSGGGTANLYAEIDEATFDAADWITYDGRGTQKRRFATYFGGLSTWPTNRRILAMRLHFVADTQKNAMLLRPYFAVGGVRYNLGPGVTVGTDRAEYAAQIGEIEPTSGGPWPVSAVQAIATSSSFGVRPYNGRSTELHIYQWWLEVDWVPETRVEAFFAASIDNEPTGLEPWRGFYRGHIATDPSPLTLGAGTSYVGILRRVSGVGGDVGAVGFTTLDSGEPPANGWETFAIDVDGDGVRRTALDDSETTTATLPLLQSDDLAVLGVDGLPYQYLPTVPVGDAFDVEQDFTTAGGGGDYRLIRFLWAEQPGSVAPNAPLVVTVKRRSDDVQMGSAETFTIDQLRAAPEVGANETDWPLRYVERRLGAAATLADATQYYVLWESDADNGPTHYVALGGPDVSGLLPVPGAGVASYGGETDCLHLPALPYDAVSADAFVSLSTVPETPTVLPVEVATLDVDWHGPNGACGVTTVDYVLLRWLPTTLGESFAYYEVQRDDDENGWQTVAKITDEAAVEFRDVEARVGVFVSYRLRVVRATDGVESDWSPRDYTTRQGVVDGAASAWLFCSNVDPSISCAYDHDPTVSYEFPDSDGVELVEMFGRDGAVRFVETEQRLDDFPLTLSLFTAATPTSAAPTDGPGRRVFDPLLRVAGQGSTGYTAKEPLPYTCVLDPVGNRWFASVQVTEGADVEPFYRHTAEVRVRELSKVPTPVDVEATGPLVLRARAAWWVDTHDYDGLSLTLDDLAGDNDGTLVAGDMGLPGLLGFTGLQYLFSPGWDDMWVDTPAVAELLTGDVFEMRWSAGLGQSVGIGSLTENCVLHQGSDQDADVSWGVWWNTTTGEITWRWSEDGTTVQTLVAQTPQTPGAQASMNRVLRFDLTTGDLTVWEQPFGSSGAAFDASVDSDSWTQVAAVAGSGPTSLFASTSDIRHSSTTDHVVGDEIDGHVTTGYGTFVRWSLGNVADGPPLLDADFSIVDVDALVWEYVSGYPPLGGSGTDSDEEATFYGRRGDQWTVHNFLTGSMPIAFVTRPAVLLGSKSSLRAGPDDAVFERVEGDDLSFVVGYRWTRSSVIGQYLGGHKVGDNPGTGDGWALLQASSIGGGVAPVVADGAAAVYDVTTLRDDGRVVSAGFSIDGAADTLTGYTNGEASGSPASLAALGPQETADRMLTLGILFDAAGTTIADVHAFGGFELFLAAVVRGTLSDDEWAAVHAYIVDADARPDDYAATVQG